MDLECKSEGKNEPVTLLPKKRPSFADDVYGTKTSVISGISITDKRNPNTSLSNTENESQNLSLAQRRSAHLPKLTELSSTLSDANFSSNDPHSQSNRVIMAELKFNFSDADTHSAEMSELYTYSEMDDFILNFEAFTQYMEEHDKKASWNELSIKEMQKLLQDIAGNLENAAHEVRLKAARLLLYILQGAYGDFAEIDFSEISEQYDRNSACHSVSSLDLYCDGTGEIAASLIDRGTGGYEKRCLIASAFNSYFIYENQLYQLLCSVLLAESQRPFDLEKCAEKSQNSRQSSTCNSRSASHNDLRDGGSVGSAFERRSHKSATIADNEFLRVIINCLYTVVENIRRKELINDLAQCFHNHYSTKQLEELRTHFFTDLDEQLEFTKAPLVIHLFEMLPQFIHGVSPHFPPKKILLLIWKILLCTIGDSNTLSAAKAKKRADAGLPGVEDTITCAASIQPINLGNEANVSSDHFFTSRRWKPESANNNAVRKVRVITHSIRTISRQSATLGPTDKCMRSEDETQNQPLDEKDDQSFTETSESSTDVPKISINGDPEEEFEDAESGSTKNSESEISFVDEKIENNGNGGDQTPKAFPLPAVVKNPRRLLWQPKIRDKDIEQFIQNQRQKYFNYKLRGDSTTMFGLPLSVHKSVEVMKKHLYTPLSQLNVRDEERFNKYKFSQKEVIEENAIERLYRRLLPNMTDIIIALLKVILASLPSSKAKNDAVTILSDVLTPETDTNEMLTNSINMDLTGSRNVLEDVVRVAIDINRHKELIIKAAASIIILLLKAFRLNHIYQFENLAQYLVLANCVPLILKFLDQNICRYFQSKHEITPYNYPQCALYFIRNRNEWPRLNADNVDSGMDTDSPNYFLWRNVYSSIQLVRILNKMTKGKSARAIMLVAYKSAPIFKRSLKAKVGIFQLYILKLLKMQSRYLGRQWRKSNMDVILAIYMRVRHRLNDDWAHANDTKTKSFDFQQEENELTQAIRRFNSRRYGILDSTQNSSATNQSHSPKAKTTDDESLIDLFPVDNSLQSALSWNPRFSARFTQNYTKWLEDEVYNNRFDWDGLLDNIKGIYITS